MTTGTSIQFHAGSRINYNRGTQDGMGTGFYYPFRDAMGDPVLPPGGIPTQSQLGFLINELSTGGSSGYARIFNVQHDFGSAATGALDGGPALPFDGGSSYLASGVLLNSLMAIGGWQDILSGLGIGTNDLGTPPFPSTFAGNTVTWDGSTMTIPLNYHLNFVGDGLTYDIDTFGSIVLTPCP